MFKFRGFSGFAAITIASGLIALTGHEAWSQATRTIRIIVPFQPGGTADIVARLLGEQIGRMHGPTVVVENRPGAGSIVGTEAVARAVPDGNTLLINVAEFAINPHLRKSNYDPLTSFEPICHLVNSPTVIVVNSASPYRSLADLLDAARSRPGALTLASVGPGSPFHLGFEMLKSAAKVDMAFIPYPGNAPAVNAVLGEHVTSMFGTYSNVAEHLKAGKLRALATATRTRIEALPEIPTIAESGYRDFEVDSWFGVVAPAKTSRERVAQLADWFATALQAADVVKKLDVQDLNPVGACGADFAAYIRKRNDEYGRIIREANIEVE
jgi:tripartite-type tricarboxylate transporter receptor subunit TctC